MLSGKGAITARLRRRNQRRGINVRRKRRIQQRIRQRRGV